MHLPILRVCTTQSLSVNSHFDLGIVKAQRQKGKALKDKLEVASAREVALTIALFHDSMSREAIDGSMDHQDDAYGNVFDLDGDLGVEYFSKLTPEALHFTLGFPEGRPVHWCHWRLPTQFVNFWDQKDWEMAKATVKPPNANALTILWHQATGVASMARQCFTEEVTAVPVPGILLADAVGVGKTAQVMGFIAFLQSVWMSEQGKCKRPPIVGKTFE